MKKSIFVLGSIFVALVALSLTKDNIHTVKAEGVNEVGSLEELKNAIDNDEINEIVITNNIDITSSITLDFKNKVVTAVKNGVSESGVVQDGSMYSLFTISNSTTVANFLNATFYGGSNTAFCIREGSVAYFENVTISRSGSKKFDNEHLGGAIMNANGYLFMKNSNVIRNVSYNAGGIYSEGEDSINVLDNCSLSENRSLADRGGGGAMEIKGGARLYANNTTISNNTSTEIGGAINCYTGYVYLLNSTLTGNATTYSATYGGGMGINGGYFSAVNCLLLDNYYTPTSASKDVISSDISTYSSVSEPFLYNCVYGTSLYNSNNNYVSSDSAKNVQREVYGEGIFANYTATSPLTGEGTSSAKEYDAPVLMKSDSGILYTPVLDNEITNNGITTYFSYSIVNKNASACYKINDVTYPMHEGDYICHEKDLVTGYVNEGDRREDNFIGASSTPKETFATLTLKNSNASAGVVEGGSAYGDSYAYPFNFPVTIYAKANDGYVFDAWIDEEGNTISVEEEYTFEVTKSMTITAIWIDKENTLYTTLENVTSFELAVGAKKPGVYANARSIIIPEYVAPNVGDELEGFFIGDTMICDGTGRLMPNTMCTDSQGIWNGTGGQNVYVAKYINKLYKINSVQGYEGSFDNSYHQINVDVFSEYQLTYAWEKDGQYIENANTNVFDVKNVSDSGIYYCKITINTGEQEVYIWSNPVIVSITPVGIDEPTANELSYNGQTQEVSLIGFDPDNMKIVSGGNAKEVGNYICVIELINDNYFWNEGSDGQVNWSIGESITNLVEKFVSEYMHFDTISKDNTNDTKACLGENGYYQIAKNALLQLESTNPGAIKEFVTNEVFNDAYDRFNAWAKANGETLNEQGEFTNYSRSYGLIGDKNVTIITIFSFIALFGVSNLIIRKRKTTNK